MEHDQKLIRSEEAHNAFAHQVSSQSDQKFVYKWAETAQPLRGQETAKIQWSVTKS